MATRYRINATWKLHEGGDPCVHLAFERVEPLESAHAEHLVDVGMLRQDDDAVSRVEIGESIIFDPADFTPKRVRRHAIEWLGEYAGMTIEDCYDLHMVTQHDLEVLARIEAAVAS